MNIQTEVDPYINQNLLTLIVGMVGLGIAEYHGFFYLRILSGMLSAFMMLSVLFTMLAYTVNYVKKKFCPEVIDSDKYNPMRVLLKGDVSIDIDKSRKNNK